MTLRRRADIALVERGLVASRARARAAIEAGLVTADGRRIERPADLVGPEAEIVAEEPHPYVSRGGVKLAFALDRMHLDLSGALCLDVGASTGGFTDVLLRRGARRVYAVDVGHGQLHPSLAADPRVVHHERQDARALTVEIIPEPVDCITVDVSFISLRLVLPNLVSFLKIGGYLIALIKPQFEVGREGIGRGGLVRDASAGQAAAEGIAAMLAGLGFPAPDLWPSPITGGDGNVEFLAGARRD